MQSRLRMPSGLHPFLFAAYAVVFIWSQNLYEVTLRDAVPPLGRAVIGAGLATIVPALLLRDLRRGAIVGSALVAGFFAFGHLTTILEDAGQSPALAPVVVIGLLLLAVAAAARLRQPHIGSVTRGLDVVALVLVLVSLVPIVPHEAARASSAGAPLAGRGPPNAGDRDIYWLVLDRYGSADSIRRFAGVENDLPDWLRARGFHVADDSHAGYGRTTLSLASALRMDYLDDIAAGMPAGSDDLGPAYRIIEDSPAITTLRERGYRYVHVGSWLSPLRTNGQADTVVDAETETDFVAVLDRTTIMPTLRDLVGPALDPDPMDRIQRERALFQFEALHRIRSSPGPKFVFAHILLPHEPYVFDENGDHPDAAERQAPAPARYASQLRYTNDRIRELLDALLAAPPDERPIVILQADEGPLPARYAANIGAFDWSTATDDELTIKFGILSAFFFPVDGGDVPDAVGPANTFRLVFSRAFGMDLPLLPERSWTSAAWRRPWELTEITGRLAGTGADR